VNLDYESEQDMVEKMRIGLALQPLATALFANSPFRNGQDSGARPAGARGGRVGRWALVRHVVPAN